MAELHTPALLILSEWGGAWSFTFQAMLVLPLQEYHFENQMTNTEQASLASLP